MKANYSKEILTYAAQQSAQHSAFTKAEQEFLTHRAVILKLETDYQTAILPKMAYHFNQLRKLSNDGKINVQSAVTMMYSQQKQKAEANSQSQQYLVKLKRWALEGYREIVSFRTFVTGGQKLVYHVKDGAHSFQVSEEEYINLLSQGNIKTWTRSWDKVTKENLNSILSLEVSSPKLRQPQQQSTPMYIGKRYGEENQDALWRYLKMNKKGLPDSRLYELYDQLRFAMYKDISYERPISEELFEARAGNGIYFSGQKIAKNIDDFMSQYIDAGLHKDTDAFYTSGDSVMENSDGTYTMVENKLAGATVSIRTIKNAIHTLAGYVQNPASKADLINNLQNFYAKSGTSGPFADAIYNAGLQEAKDGIKNTVGALSDNSFKFTGY